MQGRGGGGWQKFQKKTFWGGSEKFDFGGGEVIFLEKGQIFAKDKQK